MAVFLAWAARPPADPVGPWQELRQVAEGVFLVESSDSLSAVYHALKDSLPGDAALIVAPVEGTPKSRGMAPGTTTWLRDRT